jgi:ribonucleoside-diphosphate reductase alpha chain
MAFEWLNDKSRKFLEGGYLSEGETPEERIRSVGDRAEEILGIEGFSDKVYESMGKDWHSLSSPLWSNFGKGRGLPISCFNSHIPDNTSGILASQSEVGMMSKMGGGTSGYFGDVRPRGSYIKDSGTTSGAVHFMELFQSATSVISQGGVRRGYMAATLPIDHGDIDEFLEAGSEGSPIQTMNTCVSVKDYWLKEMIDGDKEKRKVWAKVLKSRSNVGYPYIFFYDTVNANKPDVYKDTRAEIQSTNLCSEISLPSSEDESFVCDLLSVNMLHYDDWKNTDLVETCVFLLDAVMSDFIEKLEAFRDSPLKEDQWTFTFMERAYNFAKRHRALGLGVLGWASYLQSKMIPFTSDEASELSEECFKTLQEQSYKASEKLAGMYGEPEVLKGYGRRNTTLGALAPTTSSAFIQGQVSQSIEPPMSNYYIKDLAKIKAVVKNPYLENILAERGMDTKDVWDKIAKDDGSVLNVDCLTDEEKQVFLAFDEIDPKGIIDQAAIRQKYLDQGQSLNLKIPTRYTSKQINEVTLYAWKKGITTLYYQHSANAAQQFISGCGSVCEA